MSVVQQLQLNPVLIPATQLTSLFRGWPWPPSHDTITRSVQHSALKMVISLEIQVYHRNEEAVLGWKALWFLMPDSPCALQNSFFLIER